MVERVRPTSKPKGGGLYFTQPTTELGFISSGCTTLDLVLGGGWALGRVANVIGDSSSGKTLLAIEACANFASKYQGGIWYREAEAAFLPAYAGALGMPLNRVDFGKKGQRFNTIEDINDDLSDCLRLARKDKGCGLYVIDSLDAVSEKDELARKMGEASYNMGKQKKIGEMFRKQIREVEDARVCLMIISQTRANIGVMFGDKFSISGGEALKFYSSQRLMLAHVKNLKTTRNGIERVTGVRTRARTLKNKIGLPFRVCNFNIRFGFGIDDYRAGIEWLIDHKLTSVLGITKAEIAERLDDSADWDGPTYRKHNQELSEILPRVWEEVEAEFQPKHRKYE